MVLLLLGQVGWGLGWALGRLTWGVCMRKQAQVLNDAADRWRCSAVPGRAGQARA